jgi:hypothetical protein
VLKDKFAKLRAGGMLKSIVVGVETCFSEMMNFSPTKPSNKI